MTSARGAESLPPIESHALLVDRVVQLLRQAILTGDLPPGARLSVPDLARQLNVSRTPVRDALYALERAGLAVTRPRRGAVVFGGGRDELTQLFELREPLDGMAARLAAERMSEDERQELRNALRRHSKAIQERDTERHIELDLEFHRRVRDGAGNPRLAEELARLGEQIVLVMRAVSSAPGAMGRAVLREHKAILDAVVTGQPDAAEHAARAHVRSVLRFVLSTALTSERPAAERVQR